LGDVSEVYVQGRSMKRTSAGLSHQPARIVVESFKDKKYR